MEFLLLDPGVLQDLVVPLAEVDRAGVLPLLITDERGVLAEVELAAQILDRFDTRRGCSRDADCFCP